MVQSEPFIVAPGDRSAESAGAGQSIPDRVVAGIGGFAVLVLAAANLGLPLPGGYLATDMLLVIIGYELARRVPDRDHEVHWLKHFWLGVLARMAAPLLVAVALAAAYWDLNHQLEESQLRAVLGAVTMSLNYFEIFGDAEFMAIEHLWLVAVVLQFSLAVPFLVAGARKHLDHEQRAATIIGLAAGVAICRFGFLATGAADDASIAINTFTRIDGLLVGVAIAILPADVLGRRLPPTMAAPAFGALLLLLIASPDGSNHPVIALGLVAPAAVLLTAVIVTFRFLGTTDDALSLTLDNPMLRWLGARTMSIYIWHHVFGVVFGAALQAEPLDPGQGPDQWPGLALFIMRLTFSLAAAATSYRYIELPALATASRIADRPTESEIESEIGAEIDVAGTRPAV